MHTAICGANVRFWPTLPIHGSSQQHSFCSILPCFRHASLPFVSNPTHCTHNPHPYPCKLYQAGRLSVASSCKPTFCVPRCTNTHTHTTGVFNTRLGSSPLHPSCKPTFCVPKCTNTHIYTHTPGVFNARLGSMQSCSWRMRTGLPWKMHTAGECDRRCVYVCVCVPVSLCTCVWVKMCGCGYGYGGGCGCGWVCVMCVMCV